MNQKESKYIFIELFRCIALMCVICFHSVGMMIDRISSFSASPESAHIMKWCSIFVGIAVPVFMFISGWLCKPVMIWSSSDTKRFVIGKTKRLILPYVIFTILIMLSSGFFDYRQILGGGFYHLWFLTALFWCFMASLIVDYSSKWMALLLPVALVLTSVSLPSFLGIQDFVQWYFFFVLGAIVRQNPSITKYIMTNKIWIPLVLIYIVIMYEFPYHYREKSMIHALGIGCLIVGLWGFAEKIKIKSRNVSNVISKVGGYGMGIYIMHYWLLIFILSSTAINLFAMERWGNEAIIIFFVISLITLATSIIAVACCRRFKIGRQLF